MTTMNLTISASELQSLLAKKAPLQIIDIREAFELKHGVIALAKNIPMMQLPGRVHELDQTKEIILVCRSGSRSLRMAHFLASHGFRARSLDGGMNAWSRYDKSIKVY